jgi:hypothetical protein
MTGAAGGGGGAATAGFTWLAGGRTGGAGMVGFGIGGIGTGLGFAPGFSSVDENFPISAAAFFILSSREATGSPTVSLSFLTLSFSLSLRMAFNFSIRDLVSLSSRPLDGVFPLIPIFSRTVMRSLLSTAIFFASSCTLITVINHVPPTS